jgi:hypothetical protein
LTPGVTFSASGGDVSAPDGLESCERWNLTRHATMPSRPDDARSEARRLVVLSALRLAVPALLVVRRPRALRRLRRWLLAANRLLELRS